MGDHVARGDAQHVDGGERAAGFCIFHSRGSHGHHNPTPREHSNTRRGHHYAHNAPHTATIPNHDTHLHAGANAHAHTHGHTNPNRHAHTHTHIHIHTQPHGDAHALPPARCAHQRNRLGRHGGLSQRRVDGTL